MLIVAISLAQAVLGLSHLKQAVLSLSPSPCKPHKRAYRQWQNRKAGRTKE
ncbi:hypothetical protein [Scytonema millei]|uniref:hypothetical protein n=1 Tax=Scytonema millei TaxID=1245922 RepID=UPI00398BE7E6